MPLNIKKSKREMNPREDFRGLSSGKKWKHTEAGLMELKRVTTIEAIMIWFLIMRIMLKVD